MAKKTTTITDLGEKIGGSRKDRAVKTGPRAPSQPKVVDSRPAWARRYDVQEIVASSKGETGHWSLVDKMQKDWRGNPRQIKVFPTETAARESIPLMAVARNHTVRAKIEYTNGKIDENKSSYEIWRKVTDRKQVKVVPQQFATRDEAMQHMAQNAQKIIETKTGFGEEILAKPEIAKRVGPAVRPADIAGEAFMKTLGMRGVEFGNWQGERQHVMNHAYDAFQDLAHVTGIDPKSLSLNSELGLAFGARGSGGEGAARAHYERDYAAINLTKMEGAGALAHEWFHGLDHMLGRVDDPKLAVRKERGGDKVLNTAGREQDFGSHRVTGYYKGQMPDTVRAAYKGLIDTLYSREEQFTEDAAKVQKFSDTTANNVDENIKRIRDHLAKPYEYAKKGKPATESQLKKFDDLAAKIKAGSDPVKWTSMPSDKKRFGTASRYTSPAIEELSKLHKEVRGRSGFDGQHNRGSLDELAKAVVRHQDRVARVQEAAAQTVKTRKIPTEFAREAHKLDEGRVSDYWQSKHEMAARAFSAYVEDKLSAENRQSDYLSYGSDNKYYRMMGAKPFPEGQERAAINAKFDDLFKAMRDADIVKPYAGPRHVWDDKARAASAEARAATVQSKAPVEVAKAEKPAKVAKPKAVKAAPASGDLLPAATVKDQIAAATKAKAAKGRVGDPMTEGLFGSGMKQMDLVDMAKIHPPGPAADHIPGVGNPQDKHWTYKTPPTPTVADLPQGAFAGDDKAFSSLSPGMRREIKRSAEKAAAKAPAPASGYTPQVGDAVHAKNGAAPWKIEKLDGNMAEVRKFNPTTRKWSAKTFTVDAGKIISKADKFGMAAMIAAPMTAALVAYDATSRTASAAGRDGKAATTDATKAALVAGGSTAAIMAAVGKAISVGVKAATIAAPTVGKVVARAVPGLGVGMMALGAYEGYQRHGVAGALMGTVGADAVLDIPKAPVVGGGKGRAAGFSQANATYRSMQATKSNTTGTSTRGWANPTVQAAAQAAKGRTFSGFKH